MSNVYLNSQAIAVLDVSKNVNIWGASAIGSATDISNVEEVYVNSVAMILRKTDNTLSQYNLSLIHI